MSHDNADQFRYFLFLIFETRNMTELTQVRKSIKPAETDTWESIAARELPEQKLVQIDVRPAMNIPKHDSVI